MAFIDKEISFWLSNPSNFRDSALGGGGYAWEFLVGVCHPVLHILTLFQTKKCHFPRPFSDQTSQIHTRFQTWPLAGNYVIITKIREQTKKFFKCISNSHSFILYLLIWNWNGKYKYVHTQPIVPSKTIPSSRPKWAKFIPAFGPKRPKNQMIPSGSAHTCVAYIRESLPPPWDSTKSESWAVHTILRNLTNYYMPSHSLHRT